MFLNEPYVVLDFETTGFGSSDRVIEVAAIRIEGGREQSFHALCNPGRPLPPRIQQLTGLTDLDLADAVQTTAVIRTLYGQLLRDQPILVAHNADFDLRFLNQELALARLPAFGGGVVCTMRLSRALMPGLPGHRLADLVYHLGIQVGRQHRALDDVNATQRVLEVLVRRAGEVGRNPIYRAGKRAT